MKIPHEWTGDTSFMSEAELLMEEMLRNSGRRASGPSLAIDRTQMSRRSTR
jgi:hypothetical protein